MRLHRNLVAVFPSHLRTGLASTHFVNLSTATRRWVKPEGAFLKGPTMSMPHTANGQVLERRALHVSLVSVFLASDAPLDNVDSVYVCGEPVEAVPHGLCDQRAGAGVVAAVTGMDVLEDFASFSWLNATLEHAGHTALVELAVYDDEAFVAACYHPGLRFIRG